MAPVVPDGTVVFVAPRSQRLLILHKDAKKIVVDGEVIVEPAVTTQFENFIFTTSDPERIKLLRESGPFLRGDIQDLQENVDRTREKKADEIAELLADEALAAKVVQKVKARTLKDARTQAPSVEAEK